MAKSTVISFPTEVPVFVSPYPVTRPSGVAIEDYKASQRDAKRRYISFFILIFDRK